MVLGLKICQGSEYVREFIKKILHNIDAWQGSEYLSGSEYTRALNSQGLHKIFQYMLPHR